jgi:hypothetical protein
MADATVPDAAAWGRSQWVGDRGVPAAVGSVLLGSAVMAAVATTFAWRPWAVALAALTGALATLLGGSLFMVPVGLVAGLAVIAGALEALAILGVAVQSGWWTGIALLWLAVPVIVGAAARVLRWSPGHGPADLVAGVVALVVAFSINRQVDFGRDLLTYLVYVEDNQAWVGTVTQATAAGGTVNVPLLGALGPAITSLLGMLTGLQVADTAPYNSVYAAFMLSIILVPLFVIGITAHAAKRGWLVGAVATLIVAGWAFAIPMTLHQQYGHLTAIWAALTAFAIIGVVIAWPRDSLAHFTLGLLAFAMGALWFPVIPVSLAIIGFTAWMTVREERRHALRAVVLAVLLVLVVLLVRQGFAILGVGAEPGAVRAGLETLYRSSGGTAAMDPVLQALILIGFVVAVAFRRRLDNHGRGLLAVSAVGLGFVFLVFCGAYLAKSDGSYGAVKAWFVVGTVLAALAAAVVASAAVRRRELAAALFVLAFGAVLYGGADRVLSRAWLPPPSSASWVEPLIAAVRDPSRDPDHSLACFDNGKEAAYLCTRWAAGLTRQGDPPFLEYRLRVISDQDPNPAIDTLVASGQLAKSDLLLLGTPDESRAWAWRLVEGANRVIGADGVVIDPRPTPPVGP